MTPRSPQPRRLAAIVALSLAACGKKEQTRVAIQTAPVERRNITVTAEATGTVEPINIVEVKSKASGLVTKMPVEVGTQVSAGQLIVQIDTRDVKNSYDQAVAALRAAQTSLSVSQAQKTRSDELFKQEVITPQEHETATLTYAQAQSQVVAARTNADLARQRLEDATVRAPVAGTIITKPVSQGTVITSATSGPTGGTTIVQMADLTKVRMRALVNETDVGNVKPGQVATVTVDAFPDRRFQGIVEKVEPQAVVQQSVTMFPVLISLENREGTLLPGMNGNVSMTVANKTGVLAVPADAVRAMKDLAVSARALGLDPDSAQAKLRQGFASRNAGRTRDSAAGDVATTGNGQPSSGNARRQPAESTSVSSTGRRGRSGQGAGGNGGVPAAPDGDQPQQLPFGAGGGTTRSNAQLVFVKDSAGFSPRMVRLGVTNYDYTEVLSGLREGEEVALVASATLQQQRQDQNARFRSATAGPLSSGGGGGGARAGGGGGGRP